MYSGNILKMIIFAPYIAVLRKSWTLLMIINQQYINYFYCLLLSHSPTPLLPHFPTPLLSYSPTLLLPYFHSRVGVRVELPTHSHPPNAAILEIVRHSSFIAVRDFILHSKAHMRDLLSSGIKTSTQTDYCSSSSHNVQNAHLCPCHGD